MPKFRRVVLLAGFALMMGTASANANESRYVRPVYYQDPCREVVLYYYTPAVHYYYAPAWAVATTASIGPQVQQPAAPTTNSARQLAPQTPAPASQDTPRTPEQIYAPPRVKPDVSETLSAKGETPGNKYYDAYYVATEGAPKTGGEICSVAFWNLADRPVQLKVGGQSHTVHKNQQVLLSLPRQFQWQIDQRTPEPTQLAQEQGALEIVIRR